MSNHTSANHPLTDTSGWLKFYYTLRGAISAVWVVVALIVGPMSSAVASMLLVIYPAWDAVANVIDARRNGGLRHNPTQSLNTAVSCLTTVAVAIALVHSMHAVLGVFGAWAILSGLLQLATAVRRWKQAGGQWLMVISGAQSAAAGAIFLQEAGGAQVPSVADVAPYAAFGAFYFLVSAAWLTVSTRRGRRQAGTAAGR